MTIEQALNLMISFSTLIVAIIALSFTFTKKVNRPSLEACGRFSVPMCCSSLKRTMTTKIVGEPLASSLFYILISYIYYNIVFLIFNQFNLA